MSSLLICSGGLDSVTLAYELFSRKLLTKMLSFNYGQRHQIELEYAAEIAGKLNIPYECIDISSITSVFKGSALTDNIDVPEGHYEADNMKTTVVPNRNTIMLSIAFGVAVSQDISRVATAIHAGDHFVYPDCRPSFAESFQIMQDEALKDIAKIDLLTPFVNFSKAEIVSVGNNLKVPFSQTWSCYNGGTIHCGKCGTCVERQEAFFLAGVDDPTNYLDSEYWKTVSKLPPSRIYS